MTDYIAHHGIKGMRWGVRRFQNKDGSRTLAGKKREDRSQKTRKYVARGAVAVGTVLAVYGVYKAAKAYNKLVNTPYYDAIGNYVNPKLSGPRSAGSLIRGTLRKAKGEARYDSLGQYVESTKDYVERAKKFAPTVVTPKENSDSLMRAIRSSDPTTSRTARKVQDTLSRSFDSIIRDFRNGKIDRREYAKRLKQINNLKRGYRPL